MELSVVTSLYKSQVFLEEFVKKIKCIIESLGIIEYELIFVNDGSPDASVPVLLSLKETVHQIRIVDLSRNYGHHYALQAGLRFATGDYIYLVDNDMETPIDFLSTCFAEMKKNPEVDIVYGVQEERKGHFVEKLGGWIFWRIFNMLSDVKMPVNMLTECLMTRQFVEALLSLEDANLFLGGMIHWIGFSKMEISVKKGLRKGRSTYTFSRRLRLMVEALTSFSGKPLEWLFYAGIIITSISAVVLLYLVIRKLIYGDLIDLGWTSVVVFNLLTLGIMTTFVGLVGIYVFRIYKQVQNRPNVIIRKVY